MGNSTLTKHNRYELNGENNDNANHGTLFTDIFKVR